MQESDCVFCRIVSGQIPAQKLYEDELVVAFEDANPEAPVHFLVIPKEHVPTLDEATAEHSEVLSRMLLTAARVAREKRVSQNGYRQVINCRAEGGQVVFHLHLHVLGGRQMGRMG
jgi:histidine triad (HIT) family protein